MAASIKAGVGAGVVNVVATIEKDMSLVGAEAEEVDTVNIPTTGQTITIMIRVAGGREMTSSTMSIHLN